MSCRSFLRSFAYQYCRHKYIRKNCCASHKVYCKDTDLEDPRDNDVAPRSTTTRAPPPDHGVKLSALPSDHRRVESTAALSYQ